MATSAPLMICCMGHSTKLGDFKAGLRLRSDHPAVKANPNCWLPEGLSDDEWNAELRRRFAFIPPGSLRGV